MEQKYNRWAILAAAIVVNICIGSQYAWSVFAMPLGKQFGWDPATVAMAFTITFATGPIVMICAGILVDKKGAKFNIILGGVMFGIGMFLVGFISSPAMLYLSFSIIAGVGAGTVYAGNINNTVKFFPDKRGLATGLQAAGYGAGAIIVAPLASSLIINHGVLSTFKVLGAAFFIIILLCSLVIKRAPAGYKPEGWEPPVQASPMAAARVDKNWIEMLQDVRWWVILCMFLVGTLSGMMIIAHASPIAQRMYGMTPQTAAIWVSIIALFNLCGRIGFGSLSDKTGRYSTLTIMYVLAAVVLMIITNTSSIVGFAIAGMGVGAVFGGLQAIFPSMIAENYGVKNVGVNYGITFIGLGVAAFIGPRLAAKVAIANNWNYTQAFYIAMIASIVGIALTFVYRFLDKRSKATSCVGVGTMPAAGSK